MVSKDDINSLNNVIKYSNDVIEGRKGIEEYYDDVLKELLIVRGLNSNKVFEYVGCGELINVIEKYGMDEIKEGMSK